MGKKKKDLDIFNVANKVKKGDAELLQQRSVQQALDEYGKTLSSKDKLVSKRKKSIIIFTTLICVALISALAIFLFLRGKTHIYPYIDYNIEQLVDDNVKVKRGSTVADLEIKQVAGFRFDGWYADGQHTIKLDNSKELEDKVTIYAKYVDVDNLTLTIDNTTTSIYYDFGLTLQEVLDNNNIDITDFNSCGWYVDSDMINPYDNIFKDNLHLFTKTATMDKLNFNLIPDTTNYIAVLDEHVNLDRTGNVVLPKSYKEGSVTDFNLLNCNISNLYIPCTITEISSYSSANSTIGSINIHNYITQLKDYAFASTNIPTLTLNKTVEEIGVGAFKNSGLTSIKLNNLTITSLKSEMFANCTLLEALDLSTCSMLTTIEATSLDNCLSLTKLLIPAATTNIDLTTLKTCLNLEELQIDENHATLDTRNNCNGIVTKIDTTLNIAGYDTLINKDTLIFGCRGTIIPDTVKTIATCAYNNHQGITDVLIPANVEVIQNYAFENCSNLTSILISNNLSMGVGCFKNCTLLNTVILPNNLTLINSNTFEGCYSLTEIVLPEHLVAIKEYAFTLSNLTAINIPKNVNEIDVSAFNKCYNLRFITVDENNAKYDSRNYANAVIETSSNVLLIGCSNTVIPKGVTAIGYAAFKDCIYLEDIEIPETVTTIDISAFEGCTGLTYIELSMEVDKIGANAFAGCTSLISATIPYSRTEVVYYRDPITGQMLMKTITHNLKGSWYKVDNATDWNNYENGESIDLRDINLNAIWLRETDGYSNYYWYKTEKTD